MVVTIMVIAVIYFMIGLLGRELLQIAIDEWKQEKESIKKAHDFAESEAKR